MALPLERNYKMEYSRYRHYFHRLWVFYQKPAARVSTALLLTLFTIIFFAAFAIRPTLVTVAELIKKIDDQRVVLESLKNKSAALASAQQEYTAAQAEIDKLNSAIPPEENIQALIKMLEGTAAVHQLAYSSVNIGDITYYSTGTVPGKGVQTRSFSLSMQTDYPSLKAFLIDLINIPRQVTVDSLSFASPNQQQSAQLKDSKLQMTVNLKAYFLPRDDSLASK